MCKRRAFAVALALAVASCSNGNGSGSGSDPELSAIEGIPDRDPEAPPLSPWAAISGVTCGEDAEGAFVRGDVTNTAAWTLSFLITAEFRDQTQLPYGTSLSTTRDLAPGESTPWEGRWGGPLAAVPTDEGDTCGVQVVGAEALPPPPNRP